MDISLNALKKRQQSDQSNWPDSIRLRIHRAVSWLERADRCSNDEDARFIFLWIAFNAAYANRFREDAQETEKTVFGTFINKLVSMDNEYLFHEMLWNTFPHSINILLNNEYVFGPFWDFHHGDNEKKSWKQDLKKANHAAQKALASSGTKDTTTLLRIVFSRLYVLRNQILHGGSTWKSSINRQQVRDCCDILAKIVPITIWILMSNPQEDWGKPNYPVVDLHRLKNKPGTKKSPTTLSSSRA